MEKEYKIDYYEAGTRLFKYLLEGFIVGFIAIILPKNKLEWNEIWIIGLTAACVFSILDLLSPTISNSARQGIGLGAGFSLIGFPIGL
jgi:hypothetical protein|tara:strand:+ start:359 stop:622 length:264 start_codon:yes stop_codon:yes gene_type:complete